MGFHQSILSLNGGEVSPLLRHRTDVTKHPSSLERLENFLPLPFGGIRKRPGTRHHAALAAATRLEPFIYSAAARYLLLFTATGLTIRGSDGTLKDTLAFTFGDPFALQVTHLNDLLWIVSPNFEPQLLARVDDTTWTLADVPFTYPPLLDVNPLGEDYRLSLLPSGSTPNWLTATAYTAGQHVVEAGKDYTCIVAHTSGASTQPGTGIDYPTKWRRRYLEAGQTALLSCSPSFPVFDNPGHIGSLWEISIERDLDAYEVTFRLNTANDGKTSRELVIQGDWTIISYGVWDGTIYLERSEDNGLTWEDERSWISDGTRNISDEGTEPTRVLLRLRWDEDAAPAATAKPRAVLSAGSAYIRGLVRIDSFTIGATTASVTAITDCQLGSTDYWREGAFSAYQGYPRAIAVHDRKVILAGTTREPLSLWASATDDLLNYDPNDTTATASLYENLATDSQDPILWLASQKRLFVGTARGEWVIGSEDNDAALGPETFIAREYTFYGSHPIPALRIADAVFFVQRHARRLREMAFILEREAYDAADLTRLAEHITESGITQMAWQADREPTLWAVRADGTLLAFAYNRREEIFAWSRHTTPSGLFTSIAVLRTAAGDDEVWAIVLRGATYHLESFAPGTQLAQETADFPNLYHLDSGVQDQPTDGSLQIDTPPHLDGVPLQVIADGYPLGLLTPAAGKLTLSAHADHVHAGLDVTARAITLPADTQTDTGATHGLKKTAKALNLDLVASLGGTLIADGQERAIDYAADLSVQPPALVTGWRDTTLPGHVLKDLQFEIRHTGPHPFLLRTASLDWQLPER